MTTQQRTAALVLTMVFSLISLLPAGAARAEPTFAIDGVWPTMGYSAEQTRVKHKASAAVPGPPQQQWAVDLPFERYTMYGGNASIGPDDSVYIPFFGAGYHTGGVTALDADGRVKWHFKSPETEGQAPLVVRRTEGGEENTLLIFGSNRSMNAVYDDVDNCRCCVEVFYDATDYCNFTCLDASRNFHCENGENGYEWRHRLYDVPGGMCATGSGTPANAACGWNVDMESIPNPDVPGAFLSGYLEVSATPLLSPDGETVYFLISPENYVIALNTADGSLKWVLGESGAGGWTGAKCPNTSLDWLVSDPVLLPDGDFVMGTGSGCLVRIHDNGSHGEATAVYQRKPVSPILGVTRDEEDNLYVGTQGLWTSHESFVYKISLASLMSAAPSPTWVYRASRHLGSERADLPGIVRAPALVTTDAGGRWLFFTAIDAGESNVKGDPDNGWLVRIDADNGPGVEIPRAPLSFWMDYPEVAFSRLEVDGRAYPSIHCTADGNQRIYVHGGRNRPEPGKILCYNADLQLEWSLDTYRSGFSELVLGNDYLIAVSHGSWFPQKWVPWLAGPEGIVFLFRKVPVELIDSVQAVLDGRPEDAFYPAVYKFGGR